MPLASAKRTKLTKQKSGPVAGAATLNSKASATTQSTSNLTGIKSTPLDDNKDQSLAITDKTSKLEINNKKNSIVNLKKNQTITDADITEEEEEEEEEEKVQVKETKKSIKKVNGKAAVTTKTKTADGSNDTLMTDLSSETNTTLHAVTALPELTKFEFVRNKRAGFCLAVGENLSNQLGMGDGVDDKKKPQLAKELDAENIIQVAAGGMHSACLTQDGYVYTFGCNDEFALGREDEDDINQRVNLPEKCVEITAGDSHCAALSDTGIVYAWGTFRDGNGVLGMEEKTRKIAKTPMTFKLREKISKISSGADHLVFLTVTGEVYTAGNSEHGQLGRISKYNCTRGGRRGPDSLLEPGLVRFGKRKELAGNKQMEDIWTSSYCSFLKLKDSDIIIGFGLNNCFQLGIEDCENRYQPEILQELLFEGTLKKVAGGMHHTLFLDSNGFVYSMGSHRYGGLGLGKLDADVSHPTRIADLKDIIDIAANTNVSYAIDKKGKSYSWGTNYSKQLGQDTEEDYFVPTLIKSKNMDSRDVYTVSVGGQHSLFVVSDEKDDSDQDDNDESIAT
jgi:regulator of chromosome condensation